MGLIDRRYLKEEVSAVRTIIRNQRGAALVEFAIVALLLFTLLFGIIELGLIIKDYLTLSHAAREGARSAALGSPTYKVIERIDGMTIALSGGTVTKTLEYSTEGGANWNTLGDAGTVPDENNAGLGNPIRITLTYPHQLVAGGILPFLGNEGIMTISGNMIMQREQTKPLEN